MSERKSNGQMSPLLQAYLAIEELEARLEAAESAPREPIAIIGMGCRFPGEANDPEAFWRLLRDGVDAVREVPSDRWDIERYYDADPEAAGKMYTRQGGFLDDVYRFDPQFFGIAPREAVEVDPQQRLVLEVAWEALENAGRSPERLAGSSVGVYVGVMTNDYFRMMDPIHDPARLDAYSGTGTGIDFPAGRLSYALGLQGPSMVVSTACSSSLVSVHLACQALRAGECDLALAGGVSLILSPDISVVLSRMQALAPDGRSKTFDASADGYGRGEGCGMVVLKRLSDALAGGDRVLAVLRGSAVNHDGSSGGLTVPNGKAQEALLRRALAAAGVTSAEVGYVEAHGTGTRLGDPIEVRALVAVLGEGRPADRPLLLGSVKTNIGHLEAAAGVAGLIKAVLCLQHGEIPAHLHLRQPNPLVPWDEIPVRVPVETLPWREERRVVGVNSFGLSGINAHLVVESAPSAGITAPEAERPLHLLALSARDDSALRQLAERYADHLAHSSDALADICFTAGTGRAHFAHRLAVPAFTGEEVREQLAAFAAGGETPGLLRGLAEVGSRPKVVFLFTGQGSQYPGMGCGLFETQPVFRRMLERCDELLRPHLDLPLLSVLYPEPGAPTPLDETAYTQPALFALEYALAELWRSWGIEPAALIGHSVGELVAACVAGVFGLEEGLMLAARRGALIQALPRDGEMASLAVSEERAAAAIASYAGRVSLAAVNAPESVVISGERGAVQEVVEAVRRTGAEAKMLQVSHAFHSPLLEPILDELEETAASLASRAPEIPLVSNLTGRLMTPGEVPGPGYWRRHARGAVRFADGMRTLHAEGFRTFLEIGPRATLLGLGRRCLPAEEGLWLPSLRHERDDWEPMLASLGQLYVHGATVDWEGFDQGYARRRVALPTYPFQREPYRTARRVGGGARQTGAALPGRKLRAPLLRETVFELEVAADAPALLADHRIYGTVVVPGAWYLAMALAATREVFGDGESFLEDVTFAQALVLDGEAPRTLQLVLDPSGPGEAGFRIISLDPDPAANPGWTLHATGRIGIRPSGAVEAVALDAAFERCLELPDGSAAFYGAAGGAGLELGPAFRWLRQVRRRDGEAVAELIAPEGARAAGLGPLHPGLIDSCFQSLGLALQDPAAGFDVYVPIALESLRFQGVPSGVLQVHATLRPGGRETVVGDLRLLDGSGRPVAEVRGLSARLAPQEALLRGQGVGDWMYELDWRLQPRRKSVGTNGNGGAFHGLWMIFADAGGTGLRLAQLLEERGEVCVTVLSGATLEVSSEAAIWKIDPAVPAHFDHLMVVVTAGSAPLRGVVHLWALDAELPKGDAVAALEAEQARVCGSALHLVQALARAAWRERPRLWLVTRGVQSVEEAAVSVVQAPLWGFGRVVAAEHPELWGGMLDLPPAASPEEALDLVTEVYEPDGEDQIAWREGRRYLARLARRGSRTVEGALALRPDGTYLITGGLGALGLQVARWMVSKGAGHLVLAGRGEPSDAALKALARLEQAGARVVTARADVSRADEVARLLADISVSSPPLRGVVHAAGVLDDGIIPQQDWDRFHRVFAPKVSGAWNLHAQTRDLPLDLFVLFSSAASLLGPAGQGNYAAANAFLDALAHHRRGSGLPGLSLDWGPWAGEGLAAGLSERKRRRWSEQGIGTITPEQGLAVLEAALLQGRVQVGVLPVDWAKLSRHNGVPPLLAELARGARPREEAGAAQPADLTGRIAGVPASERRRLVLAHVREQIAGVLGLPPSRLPDNRQPLQEMGLDSLMSIELRNALGRSIGNNLPATLVFDHPNIDAITDYLLAEVIAPEPAADLPAKPEVSEDALAYLLANLEELSEEEAQALLAARLAGQGVD